jgi:hypothetical protein
MLFWRLEVVAGEFDFSVLNKRGSINEGLAKKGGSTSGISGAQWTRNVCVERQSGGIRHG